jgi:hypothetical protein
MSEQCKVINTKKQKRKKYKIMTRAVDENVEPEHETGEGTWKKVIFGGVISTKRRLKQKKTTSVEQRAALK